VRRTRRPARLPADRHKPESDPRLATRLVRGRYLQLEVDVAEREADLLVRALADSLDQLATESANSFGKRNLELSGDRRPQWSRQIRLIVPHSKRACKGLEIAPSAWTSIVVGPADSTRRQSAG
jgi:hypothetical protein